MFHRLSRAVLVSIALVALMATSGHAQNLSGCSRIELEFGMAMRTGAGTSTSSEGVITKTKAEGLLGSFGYSEWYREEFAVTISAGVVMADVDSRVGSGGVASRTSVIVPILVGVRRYLPEATFSSPWRPYVSAAMGPAVGVESASQVGSVTASESMIQSVFVGRVGAGLDIQLSRLVMLGLTGGYNLMTDFRDEIGGRKNHSGADFGLSLSFLWGGIAP